MTTIDSLLFVLDPKDVDEELLKQPSTLPTEEDDNAGDGGGVPTFPKQLHAIKYYMLVGREYGTSTLWFWKSGRERGISEQSEMNRFNKILFFKINKILCDSNCWL